MAEKDLNTEESFVSPGQLVVRRFFKNKLAVIGLFILVVMFIFAFFGPMFSPYGEYEMFYKQEQLVGIYFVSGDNELYALRSSDGSVRWKTDLDEDVISQPRTSIDGTIYVETKGNKIIKIDPENGAILDTLENKKFKEVVEKPFIPEAKMPENLNVVLEDGGYVATTKDTNIKKWDFMGYSKVISEPLIDANGSIYAFCEDGELFAIRSARGVQLWSFPTNTTGEFWIVEGPVIVKTLDNKAFPSNAHWLGTDRMGLDVLTRLMYGGRVSLEVGFVVIIIELVIGILLGGLAGYYGKWVDGLIMRLVDIFNCIPSLPVMLILSSIMISMKVQPQQKIYVLMLLLGFLGWPYIARVIRGQILSLREQEYMIATEATGIRTMRKIFKHLIPNVMPQLIVIATLSIGSVILTESALSYLGVGLSFPYASWGNMVDAVNDREILQGYLNIWVPPGVCILLTVMAFNFVGDGLRDTFDPKMNR